MFHLIAPYTSSSMRSLRLREYAWVNEFQLPSVGADAELTHCAELA